MNLNMEFQARLHGSEWKSPILEERRMQDRKKRKKDKPPVPLHLQFAMAGFNVIEKKVD